MTWNLLDVDYFMTELIVIDLKDTVFSRWPIQFLLLSKYLVSHCYIFQRITLNIGGSRGRRWRAPPNPPTTPPPPPTGSISFAFAYIFTEKCMHRRLAPPPPTGRHPPPQREILDPPLLNS